jgi:hypothetical protein
MSRINTKNFERICGLNGLTPIGLAKKISRHKTTVYRALKRPNQYRPTFELVERTLPIREVPNGK